MLPLRLATQQYAWGVPAAIPSKVLSLARANGAEGTAAPDASEKFAELWVGTHPSAVSMIKTTTPEAAAQGTLSLEQWLERHPEALGHLLAERRAVGQPTGRLPFLMKVCSRCVCEWKQCMLCRRAALHSTHAGCEAHCAMHHRAYA